MDLVVSPVVPNASAHTQDPANNNPERRQSGSVVTTPPSQSSAETCPNNNASSKYPLRILGPNEEEIPPDEIVVPPDGGYGYVIVFAAFMSNMIVDGIIFSFGSLKNSILEASVHSATPLDQASLMWVGSLLTGFSLLGAPFGCAASNRFGFRVVALIGSFITAAAFLASWYLNQKEPNIGLLILFYGILGGIGFSFIHVPACISVGFYFDKKRAIATGLALCGTGVGNCVFPPLVAYSAGLVGWNNTVLATGILVLLSGFIALLYKPLQAPKHHHRNQLEPTAGDLECRQVLSEIKRNLMISNFANGVQPGNGDEDARVRSDVFFRVPPAASTGKTSNPSLFTVGGPSGAGWSWSMQKKMLSVPSIVPGGSVGEMPSFLQPILPPLPPATEVPPPTKVTSIKVKSFVASPTDLQEIEEERTSQECSGKESKERNVVKPSQNLTSNSVLDKNQNGSSLQPTTTASNCARMRTSIVNVCRVGNSLHMVDNQTSSRIIRLASKATLNKPLFRADIFYSGSLLRIPDYANHPEITSMEWSAAVTSPTVKEQHSSDPSVVERDEVDESPFCDCSCEVVKKMLDFSLLSSPSFLVLAISGMFTMLGLFVPFVFLVDHAYYSLSAGNPSLEKGSLTFLISLIGASNTIGRIVAGYVADRPFVNALLVNNVAVTVMGVSVLFVPLLWQYSHYVAFACIFGMTIAFFSSLRSIILVDLLGLHKLTNAFGLTLLFQGIACTVATPLAGMIAEFGGDGNGRADLALAFYAAGGFLLSSAIMCYPLGKLNQWERSTKTNGIQ